MKKVYIFHGWEGTPDYGWIPWLKTELEQKGFQVQAPQLPDTDQPRIEKWVPKIAEVVGTPDEDTYLVGHSMGCQAIARYLQSLPEDVKVGGVVFVAGFFKRLTNLEDDPEIRETASLWLDSPLDLEKVRVHLKNSTAIFSDDDRYVPLDNQDDFKEKLGSKIVLMSGMGHFDNNEKEVPKILEEVIEITNA